MWTATPTQSLRAPHRWLPWITNVVVRFPGTCPFFLFHCPTTIIIGRRATKVCSSFWRSDHDSKLSETSWSENTRPRYGTVLEGNKIVSGGKNHLMAGQRRWLIMKKASWVRHFHNEKLFCFSCVLHFDYGITIGRCASYLVQPSVLKADWTQWGTLDILSRFCRKNFINLCRIECPIAKWMSRTITKFVERCRPWPSPGSGSFASSTGLTLWLPAEYTLRE